MRVGYTVSEFSKADVIKELKSGVASFDKMVRRERDRNQNGGPTWWLYLYYDVKKNKCHWEEECEMKTYPHDPWDINLTIEYLNDFPGGVDYNKLYVYIGIREMLRIHALYDEVGSCELRDFLINIAK